MLLRNKKTGEVVELKLVQVNDKCLEDHEVDTLNGKKLTLKSLADSFADVKEPLIKDGKIRKAVRAWAAANDVANVFATVVKDAEEGYLYWQLASIEWEQSITIRFGDELPNTLKDERIYTIAELCGEEE